MTITLSLLLAMAQVESNGANVIAFHDGGSPSIGPYQMKQVAAREIGCQPSELMNDAAARACARAYLQKQLTRFGSLDKALCYYNTGNPFSHCPYQRKVRLAWSLQHIQLSNN